MDTGQRLRHLKHRLGGGCSGALCIAPGIGIRSDMKDLTDGRKDKKNEEASGGSLPADGLFGASEGNTGDSPGKEKSGASRGKKKTARNKKQARRKRKQRKALMRLLLAAVLTVLVSCAIFLIHRYTPTNERMSYTEYFGTMAENEAAIVLQGEVCETRAIVSEDELYIPYTMVEETLNPRFFWDEANARMLFTTADKTYEYPINSTSFTVIEGTLTTDPTSQESYDHVVVLRDDEGTLYVSASYLAKYTNLRYTYEKDTQHVLIENEWGERLTEKALKEAAVRYAGGIKSPILTDLQKGDMVYVLEEGTHWDRVLTQDGYIGYVKKNRMSEAELTDVENDFEEIVYPSLTSEEKLTLVWHRIETEDGNDYFDSVTENMSGVDVISPTWFSLSSDSGDVKSVGDKKYVKKAHKAGLSVWALVSDFSDDMDTSLVLASTAARRNCISQLMNYADELGVDGINLDFEYVEEADGKAYAQFIRELSIACRAAGLVFSVDMTPPLEFNAYYDREEVGAVADYLINMGYDEHYAGSESAGSVASIGYEESAIQTLIGMGVPANKIMTGVPFYTRIWYTSTGEDGTVYVNSEVLTMSTAEETVNTWNLSKIWDSDAGQNYVEWTTDENVLCQIWLEDADSLTLKTLLVPEYDLGGVAAWSLGFQDSSVWPAISEARDLTKEEADEALSAYSGRADTAETESEA